MMRVSPYWLYSCQGTMQTAALQVVLGAKIVSSALLKVGTVVPMPPAISWSSPMA